MPPNSSFAERIKTIQAYLNKSWTLLPRRDPYPGTNSWLPIGMIVLVMATLTVLAAIYDPYSAINTSVIKPLVSLDRMAPTAPHFAEGATVRVRLAGTIYTGPEAKMLLQDALPADNTGVIVDGVWEQGRWLYQVRFAQGVIGWVGEMDLILIR